MPVHLEPALAVCQWMQKLHMREVKGVQKNLHFLATIRKKVEMAGVSIKKQLHPVFKCQHQLCSPTHPSPLLLALLVLSQVFSI